jgi:hypothetical protein
MENSKTIRITKLEVKGTYTHFEVYEAFGNLSLGSRKLKKNSLEFVEWVRSELALGGEFILAFSDNKLMATVREVVETAKLVNSNTRYLRTLAEEKLMEFEDK